MKNLKLSIVLLAAMLGVSAAQAQINVKFSPLYTMDDIDYRDWGILGAFEYDFNRWINAAIEFGYFSTLEKGVNFSFSKPEVPGWENAIPAVETPYHGSLAIKNLLFDVGFLPLNTTRHRLAITAGYSLARIERSAPWVTDTEFIPDGTTGRLVMSSIRFMEASYISHGVLGRLSYEYTFKNNILLGALLQYIYYFDFETGEDYLSPRFTPRSFSAGITVGYRWRK